MAWPWSELGLPGPAGPEEVKHAYAQTLKQVHPEEDPEGFQRLHQAYQAARRMARTFVRSAPIGTQPATEDDPDFEDLSSQPDDTDTQEEVPGQNWDFETLFAQADEEEDEPWEEEPWEEESAWVPPVYAPPKARRLSDGQKFILFCTALIFIAILCNLPAWLSESTASKATQAQRWLEQTFQVQLVSAKGNRTREEDRFLYWRKDDPDVCFQVIWSKDGPYRTNYANAMVFKELKDFSQAWPDYPLWFDQGMTDQVGEGADGGSPPCLFLFQVPLEGAEDFLQALGDRLQELAQADWYVLQPPEYLVALAHGEAILCSYDSADRDMPTAEELLSYYQDSLCGPLLEDLLFQQDVVLWDFPDKEKLVWANTGEGSVLEYDGWWISCRGTGRDGADLTMYYFLRDDYTALYCIPSSVLDNMDEGFTLSCTETLTMSCGRAIEIYRII